MNGTHGPIISTRICTKVYITGKVLDAQCGLHIKALPGHTDGVLNLSFVKGPWLFNCLDSHWLVWPEMNAVRHSARIPSNIFTSHPHNAPGTYTDWWSLKNYIFCRVIPISARLFFVIYSRVSSYLDLKFHNLSPFCIFSIDFANF